MKEVKLKYEIMLLKKTVVFFLNKTCIYLFMKRFLIILANRKIEKKYLYV